MSLKRTNVVVITIAAPLLIARVPAAGAEDCLRFENAKTDATVALNALDAQLARYKKPGQTLQYDLGVCRAARHLKEQAAAAASLATTTCDLRHSVDAINHMRSGADADISVFCEPSLGESERSPPLPQQGLRGASPNINSACSHVVGSYSYPYKTLTVFRSDGTASNSFGPQGTWTCTGGMVTVNWNTGFIDKLVPSGRSSFSATNNHGWGWSANRVDASKNSGAAAGQE